MSTTSFHRPHITTGVARPTIASATKLVTYAATLAGVYLSVGFLFYYAAKEKLTAGAMPAGLKPAFAGSLFASIPGDNAAWILLGLIEAAIVVLLAVSLVRGEFLATRRKPFLLTGLSVGMFATGLMGFTNDMIGSTSGALQLFTYFGLIAIASMLVRQLAPYRSIGWLSGDDAPSAHTRS
jgi:hypothetical protein